jgi:Fur family ferric uptake transcriptional regulator
VAARQTRQKQALSRILDDSGAFRSAQHIHADLRSRGEAVGLTTVYNQLRALARAGEVDTLRTPDGETLYRRCGSEAHHHHLVCRRCGATVEVEGPEVESWADNVAARHGFSEISHTVEIAGTCGRCSGRG